MGKPAAMASLQCFILLGRRKKWYVVFWQPKNRALNDMTTKSEEKKKSSCQLKNTYIFFKTSLNMKFKNISTSSIYSRKKIVPDFHMNHRGPFGTTGVL